MKKILFLVLFTHSIVLMATDFKIYLTKNFLHVDGKYFFTMDVKGKKFDKAWHVTVKDGNAKISSEKRKIKGKNISIKGDVITVKFGVLKSKEANELEIMVEDSPIFQKSMTVATSVKKDAKKFEVDIGPGLGILLASAKKSKVGQDCKYALIGATLPDGTYTFKLIIPAAQDKIYKFNVINGKIDSLLQGTDNTGEIKIKGALDINAETMCRKRRGKMAAIGGAIAIPVAIGTAAVTVLAPELLGVLSGALAAVGAATLAGATASAGMFILSAQAASIAGMITSAAVSGVASGAVTGTTKGMSLGNREATAQITYESGSYVGNKSAKLEYEECRNNIFVLIQSDKTIIVNQK